MKNFCRSGNLSSLLQDEKLPDPLKPYATRLKSLYEPAVHVPKRLSNSKLLPLDDRILIMLVKRLNNQNSDKCQWLTPEKWAFLSKIDAIGCAPVAPRAFFYKRIRHMDVYFSTFTANPDDCFISFKSSVDKTISFGRIFSIFIHRRCPTPSENLFDTWLQVQKFPLIPTQLNKFNPWADSDDDLQAYLRSWGPTEDCLVKLEEVVAHCSWVMYRPHEVHREIGIPTVALQSMER